MWENSHQDNRQLTAQDLRLAMDANPNLSVRQVLANLYDAMVAFLTHEEGKNG